MGEAVKHLIDLGFGLVLGLIAVWYVAPTTTGGTVLLIALVAAGVKGVIAVVRALRGKQPAESKKPANLRLD